QRLAERHGRGRVLAGGQPRAAGGAGSAPGARGAGASETAGGPGGADGGEVALEVSLRGEAERHRVGVERAEERGRAVTVAARPGPRPRCRAAEAAARRRAAAEARPRRPAARRAERTA